MDKWHNTINIENTSLTEQEKYKDTVKSILCEKFLSSGKKPAVYIATFGCQQNEADSERLLGTAIELGFEKSEIIQKADLIIFNTCAVREHAELKALSKTGQLKHLKDKNKDLIIGLWGCMVGQQSRVDDIKKRYPYVDFVASPNMLHKLPEVLCDVMLSKHRRLVIDETNYDIVENIPVLRNSDIKAWVSIMYGCDNFCSYCIVPYVRGRERSRKPEDVISEVKGLVSSGYKEITLLGQNVNSYGKGLTSVQGYDFSKLITDISNLDGDFWIRFMTSHPKDVSDSLIKAISQNNKIERHFHLPLQSGSNDILKKMNRKYTRESYLETVSKLKSAVPDIVLTTDIIVGFPGETDDDFEKTLDIVKQVKFDAIYSFIYSPRPGTPATKVEDLTTHKQKTDRMAKLMALQRENVLKINESFVGKTVRVLCESHIQQDSTSVGRTSGFKLVKFKSKGDNYAKFVNVKITSFGEALLIGEEI